MFGRKFFEIDCIVKNVIIKTTTFDKRAKNAFYGKK